MTNPKKLCTVCGIGPREVPDRNRMPGRLVNRICRGCHSARLRGDIDAILAARRLPSPPAPEVKR